jgi:hypothetical protein
MAMQVHDEQGTSMTAAAAAAAAAQLELALRESAVPVDVLCLSIERMSTGLAQLRRSLAGSADGSQQATCEAVLRDLSACTESLQFYDRMVQHLSHLRDFLSGLSSSPDATGNAGREPAAWQELRMAMRRRLISEAQRELLDLLLPAPDPHGAASPEEHPGSKAPSHVHQGSIELF